MDPTSIAGFLSYSPLSGLNLDENYIPVVGMTKEECKNLLQEELDTDKINKALNNPVSGNYFYKLLLEKVEKCRKKSPDFVLRNITFTLDPKIHIKDWSDQKWQDTVTDIVMNKAKKAIGLKAVLEHHANGRKHCHCIAIFSRNDMKGHGLGGAYFSRYWKEEKYGNLQVTEPNLIKNKNSIHDMIKYLDKEENAFQFFVNWEEAESLVR